MVLSFRFLRQAVEKAHLLRCASIASLQRIITAAGKLAATGYPYPIDEHFADLRTRLVKIRDNFIWAPGKVVVEHPSRVNANADNIIALALRHRTSEVERELLIESPYFILGDVTIERVRQLTALGVKVRVMTNSAASHDVLPALAGYVNTRKKVLNAGVELYDLRPDSNMKRDWSALAGQSKADCMPSPLCSTASPCSSGVSISILDRRPSTPRSV